MFGILLLMPLLLIAFGERRLFPSFYVLTRFTGRGLPFFTLSAQKAGLLPSPARVSGTGEPDCPFPLAAAGDPAVPNPFLPHFVFKLPFFLAFDAFGVRASKVGLFFVTPRVPFFYGKLPPRL